MKPADIARKVKGFFDRGATSFVLTRAATLHVDRVQRIENGRFALYYRDIQYGSVDPGAVIDVQEGGRF